MQVIIGCGPISTLTASPFPSPLPAATASPTPTTQPTLDLISAQLQVEVISVRAHDPAAFTQGLLLHNGLLYESTGLYGASTLREIDPMTGEVLRSVDMLPEYFGEGLAFMDEKLIQLTWKEGTAFVYDLDSFTLLEEWQYEGEGWGLCFDGNVFYMSDGTSTLTRRAPDSFGVLGTLSVTQADEPLALINELECVDDVILANVWKTDQIVRIDKYTGRVTGVIDAAGLLSSDDLTTAGPEGVLNGIAYDPASQTFLFTGKYWPRLFEVRFVQP
ncbi:MAG: glutaminyl-peptide cyclotransferase [Anaerolineae bacterium]|nr:glutaminyl-peptide cyclotransferase [Anaerolineae bacterium]